MTTNPYHATAQHTFRHAIIHLLETEYKLVGSHRVIQMIADDIIDLQATYDRAADHVPPGHIVWRGTLDEGRKPALGRPAEAEPTVTAVLPLITADDIAARQEGCPARDWSIRRMVRLVHAAVDNPAGPQLLSLAELALLLNRSLGTVSRYVRDHLEQTDELLPIKGYVLDQGRYPTHKGHILRLYEQGMAPPDIARATRHSLQSVDRYIQDYERVKVLLRNQLTISEISHAIGKGESTVIEYRNILFEFHPDLAPQERG
jgi:hypothetical protein